MSRRVLTVLVMLICMTSYGCAGMTSFDGDSDKETEQLHKSKGELWDEVKRLKQSNEDSRRIILEKQKDIDQLNKQTVDLNKEIEDLKLEVQQAKEMMQTEIVKTDTEDKSIEDQSSPLEEPADIVEKTIPDKRIDPKNIKVKVLSGDGRTSSAKVILRSLTKMGYKAENMGMAHRSNFDVTTIYFAPEYKNEAQHLAAQLGGGTVSKSLTWPSIFHIIVVSVEARSVKHPSGKKAALPATSEDAVSGPQSPQAAPVQKNKVIGNRDSMRYHLPGMKYYHQVKGHHRVEFSSEDEALKAGYHKAPR
jgi:TolA-binding protein